MIFLFRALAVIFVSGLFRSPYAAELTVHYQQQNLQTISLADGEKLDKFYAQVQLPREADWRSSLLTNPMRQAQFEKETNRLKSKLDRLEQSWLRQDETGLVQSIRQLKREIFQIKTAGRIPAELDPDMIRLRTQHNRPLVGNYTLYLTTYSDDLNIVGLINGKSNVKLKSGWSIEEYIANSKHLAGAESSYGYLILSNGEWRKIPLAYWNKKHVEPTAGSTLFIGFDSSVLPDNFADLNDHIAAYISNRIPQ